MISRLVRAGALAVPLLGPLSALAQDVTIDHQAIECIVVGKFPKMNACFTPVSGVGKARVYFRPETLSTWFYVEMAADASCHSGVLPKPTKALVDKKIFYYVDVQGDGHGADAGVRTRWSWPGRRTARTCPPRRSPRRVRRRSTPRCRPGSLRAASPLPSSREESPRVAVTAGALVLPGDDGTPGATVPVTNPPVTSPPVTGPPTTGPPVTVPPALPPLVVACEATPRNGEAPLRVQFATFPSGGTGTLRVPVVVRRR